METNRSKIRLMLVDILDQPIKDLKIEIRTAARIWHSGVTNAAGVVEFAAISGNDLVVHVEHWLHKEMKPVAKFFSGLDDMAIKLVSPKVKQTVPVKPKGPAGDYLWGTYKVIAGDTLAKIAKTYGVSDDYLGQINHLKDKNVVSADQVLKVPPVKSRSKSPQKHTPAPATPPHSASSADAVPTTALGKPAVATNTTNLDGKPVTVMPAGQPAVIFPFKKKPLNESGGSFSWNDWRKSNPPNAACFGSTRSKEGGGIRRHAARDLYANDLTEVFSIAPGKVLRISAFYCKTHQISVHHTTSDGRQFVVRYGEVDPNTINVKVDDEVHQGKLLGKTGILLTKKNAKIKVTRGLNVSMLHFELFSGKGGLDEADNLSGDLGEFSRRSDLMDPLAVLQEGYINTFKEGAPSLAAPPAEDRIPIAQLNLSAQGESFIKAYEKRRLDYYEDSEGYCTVGWGHLTGGKTSCTSQGISVGNKISESEVQTLFSDDKRKHEAIVRRCITSPLYQHEYDALCSLVFNVGNILIKAPGLCRKINSGNYSGGAEEFLDITNHNTRGLVIRRKQENTMFLRANYDSTH
jgi:GH24 family phage-related lysozyme (muramidase)/LysM repeat protein